MDGVATATAQNVVGLCSRYIELTSLISPSCQNKTPSLAPTLVRPSTRRSDYQSGNKLTAKSSFRMHPVQGPKVESATTTSSCEVVPQALKPVNAKNLAALNRIA